MINRILGGFGFLQNVTLSLSFSLGLLSSLLNMYFTDLIRSYSCFKTGCKVTHLVLYETTRSGVSNQIGWGPLLVLSYQEGYFSIQVL